MPDLSEFGKKFRALYRNATVYYTVIDLIEVLAVD